MLQFRHHHKRRQRTNRNLIIIVIGFLCTALVGAFVFQSYIGQLDKIKHNNPHMLHISIENATPFEAIPYYLLVRNDTVLTKTLTKGKQFFEIPWKYDTVHVMQIFAGTPIETPNVCVPDSISYLMVTLDSIPNNAEKFTIQSYFLKN
ncbi:MAG: hypothetical protein LBR55_06555 [Bacteroidales bacterium]|jgi:hypothetical protein|nr:hypothetical protein [Bacteroidales bacterium]